MIDKRLMKLLKGSGKYVSLTIFWNWMSLLANVVIVFAISTLLEKAWNKTITSRILVSVCVIAAAALLCRSLFDYFSSKTSFYASVDVKKRLRMSIYQKLLRMGASYHEKVPTSEVVQMSVEGAEQLEVYYGKYLPQLFYSLLAPITLFVILSFINWKATLVLLICVPFIPISIIAVQKFAKKLLNKYWGAYTELGDSFLENLQGLTTLKIYQADERKIQEMDQEAEHFRKITMKVLTMQLNSVTVMDMIAYGGAAIGVIVVLGQFRAGALGLAGALSIILLSSEFFIPLRLLGSYFHIAMNGMAASDKIFSLLDLEEDSKTTDKVDLKQEDTIRFSDVSFGYTKEKQILHRINFSASPQSFIGLAGESGCGKSTIAALLMGIHKGYEGGIYIGDTELSQISEKSLMKHITLVNHNSYLFKGTVEENLRMGNPDATVNELTEALQRVNLLDFLNTKNGLQTKLTEQGGNLSGGQRQRLAMARALLHDTPVYIFDEATSNIDVESEELIMAVVQKLAAEKTVILISHRLANLIKADCLYVLDHGEIKESGSHQELVEKGGVYARMYHNQMKLESYRTESKGVQYA